MPLLQSQTTWQDLRAQAPLQELAPRGRLSPIIKWAGGKTRLLPELVARAPRSFRRYYEPFAGGAALFLHLAPDSATLADTNADLINLYRVAAAGYEALSTELEIHQTAHCEHYYYALRARWNDGHYLNPVARAAAFLYLNKTCFNGLWRVNANGHFNVPMGDYVNPKIYQPTVLWSAGRVLAGARLQVADFGQIAAGAGADDFVYFDPPYIPKTETSSFTAYTPGGFGEAQHLALAMEFRRLSARGTQVMLSNSDTTMSRELYRDYRIFEVSRSGSMNSDTTKRGRVGELIVTNYDPAGTTGA